MKYGLVITVESPNPTKHVTTLLQLLHIFNNKIVTKITIQFFCKKCGYYHLTTLLHLQN